MSTSSFPSSQWLRLHAPNADALLFEPLVRELDSFCIHLWLHNKKKKKKNLPQGSDSLRTLINECCTIKLGSFKRSFII